MDYTLFKREIYALTRIDLNAYKENQMKRRIEAFIRKNQCEGYKDYLKKLKGEPQALEEFLGYITINVSEFFRNPSQWQILDKEILLPMIQNKKHLRIWSAACSSGDEPYSLAMICSQYLPSNQIEIIATDIDQAILKQAEAGIYTERHLANIPPHFKKQFFTEEQSFYKISNDLKKCIKFRPHNLLLDPYPKQVDLIVCRNVLIYFTEESKSAIYKKFSQSLTPEGVLFVGSTEQIIHASSYGFSPYQVFFYKK